MSIEMKENAGIIKESRKRQTSAFPAQSRGAGTIVQRHEASVAGPFVGCHKAHHQRWVVPVRQDEHNGCAAGGCAPSAATMPPHVLTGIHNR